jgi:hypothetical protein
MVRRWRPRRSRRGEAAAVPPRLGARRLGDGAAARHSLAASLFPVVQGDDVQRPEDRVEADAPHGPRRYRGGDRQERQPVISCDSAHRDAEDGDERERERPREERRGRGRPTRDQLTCAGRCRCAALLAVLRTRIGEGLGEDLLERLPRFGGNSATARNDKAPDRVSAGQGLCRRCLERVSGGGLEPPRPIKGTSTSS